MTLSNDTMPLVMAVGAAVVVLLLVFAFGDEGQRGLDRRLNRVSGKDNARKLNADGRSQKLVRKTDDSNIKFLNQLTKFLPNAEKMRSRLARTGRKIGLGEYMLVNGFSIVLFFLIFYMTGFSKVLAILLSIMLGLGLPHMVIGFMGKRRIKKFLAKFPEAIDTMCRGLRSGVPVTETIAAVGHEMDEPIGSEMRRIADGVRMGKSLEASMWEVAQRIDAPEYRFLIIAMSIQNETGGNLAETLGNLADLIRRRRQLRLKIKALSAEGIASAMIIGSLPFVMSVMLYVINKAYIMTLFESRTGEFMVGGAVFWMCIGWAIMIKMINFAV